MCHRTIVANVPEEGVLYRFRTEWVHGHLHTQRAAEALEEARRAWKRAREGVRDTRLDSDELRRAQDGINAAAQRLAEVKALLAEQFDRFCG